MVRLESVLVSVFRTVGGLGLGTFLGWAGAKAEGLATFSLPGGQLVLIVILGGVAGIVAAIRPARRAARLPLLAAIAAE